jgi:hypothetical protein
MSTTNKGREAMPVHSSKLFHYKDKVLSIEVSMLGPFAFGRLYPDACDMGFGVRSIITNKIAYYYVSKTDVDADNDVRFWELLPTDGTLRKLPGTAGTKVIVFND